MKKIESFKINHNILKKGMYVSRIDGDCITYDIRMKIPNNPENDYLEDNCLHTIEHLFATYVRNSRFSGSIIYAGPMGCRTGFYFITRDDVSKEDALNLVRETMKYIYSFEGEIPGSKKEECGNYLAHDLKGAKAAAGDMLEVLENWNTSKMVYPI